MPIPTKRPVPKPTKRRKNQVETKCYGDYCNEMFWNKNITEIRDLEEKNGHWISLNKHFAKGDYLPNEKEQTCGKSTKTGYIEGSTGANIGEFPFVAVLGKIISMHEL